MRRWVVIALVALVIGPALPARAATGISDGTGPLDTAPDLAAAMRFEAGIPTHTFGGMVVPLYYDKWPSVDANAKPTRMDGEADSGNYTGVYLAAESWRYAQATRELRKRGTASDPETARFWRAQRDEARSRAAQIIRYYHVLVNIASVWQTQFAPKIDMSKDPTELGWLDLGGGIFPGEKGLLMRACSTDHASPAYSDLRVNHGPTGKLFGPFHFEGDNWYCLNGTSRDSYAGTVFGLSVALDFLATPQNLELRQSVADDLMAMADYAYKYGGLQPRPHGVVANPAFGHNDLEGPISPLFFPQAPIQRLHLLQTARHAAAVTGDEAAKARYDVLWAAEVASTIAPGQVLVNSVVDAAHPHDAYYKFQLELMSFFDVIRLEPNAAVRESLRAAMAAMWATVSDDGNAFFEAMTYALTGQRGLRDLGVRHHREWLDYYAFHEATARRGVTPFVHTGRCNITGPAAPGAPIDKQPLVCVPKDRNDMTQPIPGGRPLTVTLEPGDPATLRAKDPLPVGVRRLADFLWQKDPTIIGGDHNVPWQGPSIDFLVSYWMLRYYSEVHPWRGANPLPAWGGPTFS